MLLPKKEVFAASIPFKAPAPFLRPESFKGDFGGFAMAHTQTSALASTVELSLATQLLALRFSNETCVAMCKCRARIPRILYARLTYSCWNWN